MHQRELKIHLDLFMPQVKLIRDLLSDTKKLYPNERRIARTLIPEIDKLIWYAKTDGQAWPYDS